MAEVAESRQLAIQNSADDFNEDGQRYGQCPNRIASETKPTAVRARRLQSSKGSEPVFHVAWLFAFVSTTWAAASLLNYTSCLVRLMQTDKLQARARAPLQEQTMHEGVHGKNPL